MFVRRAVSRVMLGTIFIFCDTVRTFVYVFISACISCMTLVAISAYFSKSAFFSEMAKALALIAAQHVDIFENLAGVQSENASTFFDEDFLRCEITCDNQINICSKCGVHRIASNTSEFKIIHPFILFAQFINYIGHLFTIGITGLTFLTTTSLS